MFDITDINSQSFNVEAPLMVDEVSSTQYYIGQSKNTSNTSQATWRIKSIWKTGSVWNFGFPNGDQDFKYVWDLRDSYDYSS